MLLLGHREALDSGDLWMGWMSVFDQSTFFKMCQVQAGVREAELTQTKTAFKENPVIGVGGRQEPDPM